MALAAAGGGVVTGGLDGVVSSRYTGTMMPLRLVIRCNESVESMHCDSGDVL
jgi:hypothetical protein